VQLVTRKHARTHTHTHTCCCADHAQTRTHSKHTHAHTYVAVQLVTRKLGVFLKATDPRAVNEGMLGISSGVCVWHD